MDLETAPKFYEEIRKIRNSAGTDYSEVIKVVYRYKDKYGLSRDEVLCLLKSDIDKLGNALED